jgi:thiaminase/transcriptional activator TenA
VANGLRFSDQLRAAAASIWQAQLDHPFVHGIAAGDLEPRRFERWIRQDYLFLVEHCRVLALAAARAPDLATLTTFAELLKATAQTEMDLHRRLAQEFGITRPQLEAEPMAATTRAYTDFLIRVGTTGDFAELAAALLPCMWAFSEIGLELAKGRRPRDPHYAAWIESYASPEFAALAAWCRELVDRLAAGAGRHTLEGMTAAFLQSSRYELAFWEMAWSGPRMISAE